jgi:hypothetical protein
MRDIYVFHEEITSRENNITIQQNMGSETIVVVLLPPCRIRLFPPCRIQFIPP